MNLKKLIIVFFISFLFVGCQTIKEKSDAVAEKENKEYGSLVGKTLNELKIELGNPTEDFLNEAGNRVLIYKSKKFGIPCDRKFELDRNNTIISLDNYSSGSKNNDLCVAPLVAAFLIDAAFLASDALSSITFQPIS